jgi:hypothetical protein
LPLVVQIGEDGNAAVTGCQHQEARRNETNSQPAIPNFRGALRMKVLFRFGAVAGLVLCLPMFAPYFVFGLRPEWMSVGEVVGYASMLLCMTATYFAIKHEQRLRGPLGYGQALAVGAGVSAVAGLTFGAATWIFYLIVGDALPEALFQFYVNQINDAAGTEAERARRLAELDSMRPMFFNRPLQAAVMAATVFVIGVVESLAAAWWVVRRGIASSTTQAPVGENA